MSNEKEWQKWLEYHCHKHWDRLVALYGKKIGEFPKIEISKRMTRCYGIAYADPKAVIRFSWKWLCTPNTHFMYECDTIPHEIAHIAGFRLSPFETPHGETWRKIARQLGISDTATANYKDYIPKGNAK